MESCRPSHAGVAFFGKPLLLNYGPCLSGKSILRKSHQRCRVDEKEVFMSHLLVVFLGSPGPPQ
jgi:hypothetical protein